MTDKVYRHARDIADKDFLDAVNVAAEMRGHSTATRWDVAQVLYGNLDASTWPRIPETPGLPQKVVIAKAKRLIDRGYLNGCACSCRGHWSVISYPS